MRRNLVFLVMITFILSVALVFSSCAKKLGTSEGAGSEKQAVAQKQSAADQAAPQKVSAKVSKTEAELKEVAAIGDLYFEYNKASLSPEGKKALQKYADWLKAHPKYVVKIEGHCDERGTVEYNMALGEKRANAAMQYIVTLGLDKSTVSTVSYGKERPVDQGHSEAAWWKNRRDHLVVSPK